MKYFSTINNIQYITWGHAIKLLYIIDKFNNINVNYMIITQRL